MEISTLFIIKIITLSIGSLIIFAISWGIFKRLNVKLTCIAGILAVTPIFAFGTGSKVEISYDNEGNFTTKVVQLEKNIATVNKNLESVMRTNAILTASLEKSQNQLNFLTSSYFPPPRDIEFMSNREIISNRIPTVAVTPTPWESSPFNPINQKKGPSITIPFTNPFTNPSTNRDLNEATINLQDLDNTQP